MKALAIEADVLVNNAGELLPDVRVIVIEPPRSIGGRLPPVLAAITVVQIIEILVIFAIMNVVILTPVILAVLKTYLEYNENQELRRSRR